MEVVKIYVAIGLVVLLSVSFISMIQTAEDSSADVNVSDSISVFAGQYFSKTVAGTISWSKTYVSPAVFKSFTGSPGGVSYSIVARDLNSSIYVDDVVFSGSISSPGHYVLTVSFTHRTPAPAPVPCHYTLDVIVTAPSFTVSFDTLGGSACQPLSGTSIVLPSTSKNGFVFDGWFTQITGGSFVGGLGASFVPSSNVTLYAHWTPIINVSDGSYAEGTNVTLTPVADPSVVVSVSGADWLTASGNVISGVVPLGSAGTVFHVTVTAQGASATFDITSVSKLEPTNSPTAGAIVVPK